MQTELNYDVVFDAQEHFRLLLDSMSRPGKINTYPLVDILPPEGITQAAGLTGFALLNADVSYCIAGENAGEIADYLLVNTASQKAELGVADYVFVPEDYFGEELYGARNGTATYPEDSTTLILSCELISDKPHGNSRKFTLKGPGVNGEAEVYISGIKADLLHFIKDSNSEYPLGIDLVITDRDNNILGIPRSNNFSFSHPEHFNL